MEPGLLKIEGAQEIAPDKYTSLATIKFLAGLQTQRSAYASIDTRYNSKFLGGKPDALIAGSNVEISNRLTLQRRPGLLQYGTANIPAPVFFYDWQLATTTDIILVIDTETSGGDNHAGTNGAVFNYSPTSSGIYVNKAATSQQTNFMDVVNTLYLGDGVDLYKIVGPNLLSQSNTFFAAGAGIDTNMAVFPAVTVPWNDTAIAFNSTSSPSLLQSPNLATVASQVSNLNTFSFAPIAIVSAGHLLIITASFATPTAITPGISDTASNVWTKRLDVTVNGIQNVIWSALSNGSGATTITVTSSANCLVSGAGFWEVANMLNTVAATTHGSGNSSSPAGGALAVTANNFALTLASTYPTAINTLLAGAGWSLPANSLNLQNGVNNLFIGWQYQTASGSGSGANPPWMAVGATMVPGQSDPLNGTAATQLTWSSTSSTDSVYLKQTVIPNYTPIAYNTFTFSFWLRSASGAQIVSLEIEDQSGDVAVQTCVLTTTWTKYQVTGTMNASSTEIDVLLTDPTTTNVIMIYGAQLEVGGPATTTQITTTKPQGVYLWGILAPTTPPTFTTQQAVGNTGQPWQANHLYSVGDTIVDNNGNLQYATNDGIFPQKDLTLASVATGTGVYTGTITGGANNAYAGASVRINGYANAANNGTFTITASSATTITTNNATSTSETHAATASLGVVGTSAGLSGGSEPTWNKQVGGQTNDGLQNIAVQSITTVPPASANNASVTFNSPVTPGNLLVVCVYVSHPQVINISDNVADVFVSGLSLGHGGSNPGDSGETRNNAVSAGQFSMYLFYVVSAVGGNTTISVSGGGNSGTFIAAAELTSLNGADGSNFNSGVSRLSSASTFTTGGINTANAADVILTIGAFASNDSIGTSANNGVPPSGYTIVSTTPPTAFVSGGGGHALLNLTIALLSVKSTGFYDPQWTITNPNVNTQNLGITGSFKSTTTTLIWINMGEEGAGLTGTIGFQWYYSYGNSYTGHFSNVSPISTSTGAIIGQDAFVTGATRPMTNPGSTLFTPQDWANRVPWETDPQSDLVAVYRNTDGGGFFYQVGLFGNGATAQAALLAANYPGLSTDVTYTSSTWTFEDTTPDISINTAIFAPIGLLNSLPPVGLKNLEYFAGRMWGSVANILYYNTSADNATLLGIKQNGVASESWVATNNIPFNSFITRSIAVGGGLIVCTVTDTWFVTGQNLLTGGFNPQKSFAGHGLRSYNAACLDGSSVWIYTSDRNCLIINPNSGSVEFGFAVGDYIEANFSPLDAYLVRHISGSQDNALFFADNDTGWLRMNPNQQGASMQGEATPVWSPKADFTNSIGGISAIGSIETAAGVHKFLVGSRDFSTSGLPVAGPVLVRDLNTFSDLGVPYSWSATIGSILLATAGKLAETESITTEMNNTFSATFALTSVEANTGVYHGTITGGTNNAYVGRNITITGFANSANNGVQITITGSSATQIVTAKTNTVLETIAASAKLGASVQCTVSVLLDEISGDFETLAIKVNDPPQLNRSSSVISNRFYLAQDTGVPVVRHIQIQVAGGAFITKDEMLAMTIRGCLVPEQV